MEWTRTEGDHAAHAGRGGLARLRFRRPVVRRRVRQVARLAGLVLVAALGVRWWSTEESTDPASPVPGPATVAASGAHAARPSWSAAEMLDHLAHSVPSGGEVALARVAIRDRLLEADATATSRQALGAWAHDLPQRAGPVWRLSSMSVDLAEDDAPGLSARVTWGHDPAPHEGRLHTDTASPSTAAVAAFHAGIERLARWSVVTTLDVGPEPRPVGRAATAGRPEATVTARLTWEQLRRVVADIETWAEVAHLEATVDGDHPSTVIGMTTELRAYREDVTGEAASAGGARQATRHRGTTGGGRGAPRSPFGQAWAAVTSGLPSGERRQHGAEAPGRGDRPTDAAAEWEVHGIVRDAAGWRAAMRHRRGDIRVVEIGHELEGTGRVASVTWEGVRLVAVPPGAPEDTGSEPTRTLSARAAQPTPGARP